MNKINLAAILCVRNTSTRLPNKPLLSYHPSGRSNLLCITDRVLTSRHNPVLVVATYTDKSDDSIFDLCVKNKLNVYRGDLNNVVRRFDGALQMFSKDANYVWRVMGDCPLVDVGLVDLRLDVLPRNRADMMTIMQPEPTYAAQASVWSREVWDYCAKMSSGSLLEHPGEYIYEHYGEFKTLHELGPESVYYQDIRTELDTEKDLEFFRRVWKDYLVYTLPDYSTSVSGHIPNTKNVLTWLSSQPHLTKINRDVPLKTKSIHLHGHSHARRFVCKNCSTVIGYRINDKLSLQCPSCGETRGYY